MVKVTTDERDEEDEEDEDSDDASEATEEVPLTFLAHLEIACSTLVAIAPRRPAGKKDEEDDDDDDADEERWMDGSGPGGSPLYMSSASK